MSSSAVWVSATSDQSSTCNKLSSERNDLSVMSVKATRPYQVSLRRDDSVWILEH